LRCGFSFFRLGMSDSRIDGAAVYGATALFALHNPSRRQGQLTCHAHHHRRRYDESHPGPMGRPCEIANIRSAFAGIVLRTTTRSVRERCQLRTRRRRSPDLIEPRESEYFLAKLPIRRRMLLAAYGGRIMSVSPAKIRGGHRGSSRQARL